MAEKFRMRQIRLDRGGYDSHGVYYGVGPVLYEVIDPGTGDGIGMVRANVGETKQGLARRITPRVVVKNGVLKLRQY